MKHIQIHNWENPPTAMTLPEDEIHIWKVDLKDVSQYSYLIKALSIQELNRVGEYKSDIHRNSFIATKGILKTLLSRYLTIGVQNVQFMFNPQGKPSLDFTLHNELLHFNTAYTHEYALFIFARSCQVGIDIEYIKPLQDYTAIIDQFFSEQDFIALMQEQDDKRLSMFYKLWTRNEALLKASGVGLVSMGDVLDQKKWSLHDFDLPGSYAAAFAYEVG